MYRLEQRVTYECAGIYDLDSEELASAVQLRGVAVGVRARSEVTFDPSTTPRTAKTSPDAAGDPHVHALPATKPIAASLIRCSLHR